MANTPLPVFRGQGLQLNGTFDVEGSGPSWAHPVVIGGRLYLRYDTNLYCFDRMFRISQFHFLRISGGWQVNGRSRWMLVQSA